MSGFIRTALRVRRVMATSADYATGYSFSSMREDQQTGIQSGTALMRHVRACHGGEFLPDCPACVELKLKVGGVN